jgi:DNA-binding NtrC family response regulator
MKRSVKRKMAIDERLSFRAMLDAIKKTNEGQPLQPQSSNFPEICSRMKCPFPDCEYYETGENEGKPCRFASGWRTTPQEVAKNPNPPKAFHEAIEEAVKRAFKPIDEKLKKIEREAFEDKVEDQQFNGKEPEKMLRMIRRAEGLNVVGSN